MQNQYRIFYDGQTVEDANIYEASSFLHAAILSATNRIATAKPITFAHIIQISTGKKIKARVELKQYNFINHLK